MRQGLLTFASLVYIRGLASSGYNTTVIRREQKSYRPGYFIGTGSYPLA